MPQMIVKIQLLLNPGAGKQIQRSISGKTQKRYAVIPSDFHPYNFVLVIEEYRHEEVSQAKRIDEFFIQRLII